MAALTFPDAPSDTDTYTAENGVEYIYALDHWKVNQVGSTLVTLTGSQTLTNKTIDLDANTVTGTLAEFNTALQSDTFLAASTYDADTLKADVSDTMTAGFATDVHAMGDTGTDTQTPSISAGENFKSITNGGAHTLAPQTTNCTIVVQYTNAADAGAITTSGWDIVTGDDFTTTDGDDFMCYLTVSGTFQHLHVVALQ